MKYLNYVINITATLGWLLLLAILIDGLLFNCKNTINLLEAL